MAYGVCNVSIPTQNPEDIKFGINANDIQNGSVVVLGGLKTGYKDVYEAVAPTTGEEELWLVSGVEMMYEEVPHKSIRDYINVGGRPFRVYRLACLGADISKENLTIGTEATDMVAGAYVVASGAMKLALKATLTANDIVVGTVKDVFTRAGIKFAFIEFLRHSYKYTTSV